MREAEVTPTVFSDFAAALCLQIKFKTCLVAALGRPRGRRCTLSIRPVTMGKLRDGEVCIMHTRIGPRRRYRSKVRARERIQKLYVGR
jgi:hypothetical protein